jgi:hypothetical protein
MLGAWARLPQVLVAGWPSFIHGEATNGDVLAMEAAAAEIDAADVPYGMEHYLPATGADAGRRGPGPIFAFWSPPVARSAARASTRATGVSPPAGGSVGVSVIEPADPAAAVSTRSRHETVPALWTGGATGSCRSGPAGVRRAAQPPLRSPLAILIPAPRITGKLEAGG